MNAALALRAAAARLEPVSGTPRLDAELLLAHVLGLSRGEDERAGERQKPAVAANKSIHNDYIICLEDGRKLKMLKRYLRSTYNMSPEEYRKRWNLPADYPMVAPAYAARRSEFAKKIGLGKGVRRKEP